MESNEDLSSSDDPEKGRKRSLRPRKPEKLVENKPVDDKVKKQTEKNRLKVKAWRNRQKMENPTYYDALKKADRDRKKKERMKVKQMANSDPELKVLLRKKKAEEMKIYRQRKKVKAMKSMPSSSTLSEISDGKKSKAANLKEKKKEAVKRTQRWRMRIKLNKSQTMKNTDNNDSHNVNTTNEGNISRASMYRRVKTVKDILPRTPTKKAAILKKIIESPSTSKILSDQGVTMTPACKKKLKVANAMVESVKESISEVKSGGQKDREKKHAYNVIRGSVLKKYSKYTLGKYFSVSYNARKMNAQWWKKKQRKRRSDAISEDVKQSVKDFFLSAEVSREVPCKREVVRIKTESGKKETLQKHVMTMTLEEAHKLYKTKHPSHKIGLTSFSKLKPVNVKKVSETSRRTCLCQICCNIALKVEALATVKRAVKEKGMVDDIQIDKKSLSDVTFCSYEHEPSVKCLTRNCENCGVGGLRKYLEPLDTKNADDISWYHWETIEIKKDEKLKRCVSCVPKKTNFQTFVAALEKDMAVYPAHAFRASWQQKQMGVCIETLLPRSVSMVMDFSENYGCVFQSEVQSGFFDRNQVTVHPMMCYYKENVGDKVATVKHAIIGISEETKHDADLAIAFENRALETLENMGVNIKEVHEWTDGCAAQYKGKKAFADISLRKEPTIVRNYFETSHGKNVCDGLGATVKNACYRAVISNREVIGNAEDVYNFCQNNLKMETADNERNTVSRREFVFIENANRNRPETNVQTLTGTRKLHSVKSSDKEYELFIRNLSCYCDACVKGNNPGCENPDIVDNWEQRNLELIDKTTDSKSSKRDQHCSKKQPQSQIQKRIRSKGESNSEKTETAKPKRRKIVNTTPTSPQSVRKHYTPGDFVAVGLKPRKGPISVYVAEVTHVYEAECGLKYMRKSGNVYVWPDTPDMSQELTENIIAKLENPQLVNERGHFKFKTDELHAINIDLMKIHKHTCFK